MERGHQDDYGAVQTHLSERALVTLIGDLGPWSERIVLVGGLAPRYIVGSLPTGASPHAGTTDVDVVIGLAVEDSFESYDTLQTNLKKSGFKLGQPSYQWSRRVDGARVSVDFLCETDNVPSGKIGPHSAGLVAAKSPVRDEPQVADALQLLADRFRSADHDGPSAYSNFLALPDDTDRKAQLRNEAVAAVVRFLSAAGAE